MTYVLYVDVMLIWSSIINVVVLILAAAISGTHIKPLRIIVWAVLTGIITTLEYILMLGGNSFLHYTLYVAIYIIMTTSFFTCKSFSGAVRRLLAILISMLVVYGVWKIIEGRIRGVAAYAVFILSIILSAYLFVNIKKAKSFEMNIYDISIHANKKCIRCRGYLDSGNNLYDYATGCPVVIINYRLVKKIFGENIYKFFEAYHKTGKIDYPALRGESRIPFYPVFYSTVSQSHAVMPAFKISKLCILSTQSVFTDVVAGISQNIFGGNDYQILLHSNMKGVFK